MDDNWKKEYDQRQYRLMANQLERFVEGASELSSLVGSLKSLLSVLESTDEAWKDKFRSEWGTLETVYALSLYRKDRGLAPNIQTAIGDPADRAIVDDAVQSLQRLVSERINAVADGE